MTRNAHTAAPILTFLVFATPVLASGGGTTPGHSDDSVSLLLDDGSVFTGDLTPEGYIGMEDPAVVAGWGRPAALAKLFPTVVR